MSMSTGCSSGDLEICCEQWQERDRNSLHSVNSRHQYRIIQRERTKISQAQIGELFFCLDPGVV